MANVGTQQQFEIRNRPTDLKTFFPSCDLSIFQMMVDDDKFPQRITLYGPPGLGKTTLAHILAGYILKLDKDERIQLVTNKAELALPNFKEADFATNPSAEYTSQIADLITQAIQDGGLFGKTRYVFILDEFTQLRPETQKRLIKLIADHALDNIYVIITTNDISKVEGSFDDRMLNVRFGKPGENAGIEYIQAIAKKEKLPIKTDEARRIYHASTGSYRNLTLNLWSYLTYGKTLDESETDSEHGPIKTFTKCLAEITEEVWRVERDAQRVGANISYREVSDTRYNALLASIETLAIAKKSTRSVYEALVAFILHVLRKPGSKYDNLTIGYELMTHVEALKKAYDANPVYELIKLSEAVIRARISRRMYIKQYATNVVEPIENPSGDE